MGKIYARTAAGAAPGNSLPDFGLQGGLRPETLRTQRQREYAENPGRKNVIRSILSDDCGSAKKLY